MISLKFNWTLVYFISLPARPQETMYTLSSRSSIFGCALTAIATLFSSVRYSKKLEISFIRDLSQCQYLIGIEILVTSSMDTLLYLTPQLPGVPVGFVRSSFRYVFDPPFPRA